MARISFVELPVADAAATGRFYEQAFAMKITAYGPTYACTTMGEGDIGLQADPAEKTFAPLPVILVDDLEAVEQAVIEAGGTITRQAFSFPGGRRFQFRDPAGNELAVAIEVAE
ncbi:VOC family protein [Sphingomonas sp. ID0503]|uniref:VOC family protein n=1 Tax=Sphingomonas sp. ID0503 TaxID=3399691 RepID=UPI003AFA9AB2